MAKKKYLDINGSLSQSAEMIKSSAKAAKGTKDVELMLLVADKWMEFSSMLYNMASGQEVLRETDKEAAAPEDKEATFGFGGNFELAATEEEYDEWEEEEEEDE